MALSSNSKSSGNHKLRRARKTKSWTIAQASERVGVDVRTYSRWEQGIQTPQLAHLQLLCQIFSAAVEELGFDISEMSKGDHEG